MGITPISYVKTWLAHIQNSILVRIKCMRSKVTKISLAVCVFGGTMVGYCHSPTNNTKQNNLVDVVL